MGYKFISEVRGSPKAAVYPTNALETDVKMRLQINS